MSLFGAVAGRRAEVARVWADLVLATYPAASAKLFAGEKDPFRNPVGATVRRSTSVLLDGLLGTAEDGAVLAALDAVVRLRAVQDFTAGQAVGFVFLLKRALQAECGDELASSAAEARELDERIDALALRAVDLYAACRDRLAELRAREASARVHSLLKRAGMAIETEVEGGSPP